MQGSSSEAVRHHSFRERAGAMVVISHRRADSEHWTARLAHDLREYLGGDRVRLHGDTPREGEDHRLQIVDLMATTRVTIAVLGPHWLDAISGEGPRWLDDPRDTVRLELERSMADGGAVIPVLVGGARMPAPIDLPHSLRPLARLDAQVLRDGDWRGDVGRLLQTLERHGLSARSGRPDDRQSEPRRSGVTREVLRTARHERTLRATSTQAFVALARAVDLLGYPVLDQDPEAAEVRFSALARTVTAKVVEGGPGHCRVVVEFASLSWLGSGGSALVILPGVLLGAAVKAQDSYFARGFLDNVQRVAEGKGVGRDSARVPGMDALREKLGLAER